MDYNINKIRPALVYMRENGNKGCMSRKICEDLGISEGYLTMFENTIKNLYAAVSDYCRKKNSPAASAEDVKASYDAIFPLWRALLSSAEKDADVSDFRVREDDVSNLVGFCQRFTNDKNDLSLGSDDSFVAQKRWATNPVKMFQKSIETDLGIRIAKVEVMTDAEREYLRAEAKHLSRLKKAVREAADLQKTKAALEIKAKSLKTEEAKSLIKADIDLINTRVAGLQKKAEGYRKSLDALHVGGIEAFEAPAEAPAEVSEPAPAPAEVSAEVSAEPAPASKKSRKSKAAA